MEKYLAVREKMQTGDCLQWRSASALGWLIRFFTRSDVNHTGIVIRFFQWEREHIFTLEVLEHGVVLQQLSKRLSVFDGACWWYPLKPEYDRNRDAIAAWAINQAGTEYDYESLFKQMFSRVSANARALFCSEYAYLAWQQGGVPVPDGPAPRPCDIPALGIFNDPTQIM